MEHVCGGVYERYCRWASKPGGVRNWGKERWRLNGDVAMVDLGEDAILLDLEKPFEVEDVFHKGMRRAKRKELRLEKWGLEFVYLRQNKRVTMIWVRFGLLLHFWNLMTLRKLGDVYGGFIEMDNETEKATNLEWARVKVVWKGGELPSTIVVEDDMWSYKVVLWWEMSLKREKKQSKTWAEVVNSSAEVEGEEGSSACERMWYAKLKSGGRTTGRCDKNLLHNLVPLTIGTHNDLYYLRKNEILDKKDHGSHQASNCILGFNIKGERSGVWKNERLQREPVDLGQNKGDNVTLEAQQQKECLQCNG